MSVQFRCPCGTTLRANSSVAGKKISCPKCGKQLLVKPSQSQSSPDPRAVTEDDNIEDAEDDDRTTSRTESNMQKPSPKPAYSSTRSVSPPSPTSSTTYQFPSTDFPKPARGTLSGSNKSGASAMPWPLIIGISAVGLLGTAAYFWMNRSPSIADTFQPTEINSQPKQSETLSNLSATNPSNTTPSSQPTSFLPTGGLGPEVTSSNKAAIRLAEEFASFGRQGNASAALRMISDEDFDKRQKDGPTASWEAIVKRVKGSDVLKHMSNKTLESTPLDEGFRHWRVLGETKFEGQDAELLRYYSDPEYPHQLVKNSDALGELTKLMTFDEFQSAAPEMMYDGKDRDRIPPPNFPDTIGFLPPRFGYLILIIENAGDKPKVVDVVNVLGQIPMSQIAGSIYLVDWDVIQIGIGSESEFKQRLEKANAAGRRAFSLYGTIPKTPDITSGFEHIPVPPLWFLRQDYVPSYVPADSPLANVAENRRKANQEIVDWVAAQPVTRTTRLVNLARALQYETAIVPGLMQQFRNEHPNDPGADLTVLSAAMTPVDPYLPDELISVIDQSASKLYTTFNDPFMLYVRGLVQEAKGDLNAANKLFMQANKDGFISMRMLRKPFEQAVKRVDKQGAIDALKQINAYWAKGTLDKSTDSKGKYMHVWDNARDKANMANNNLVQRDAVSGGLGRRDPTQVPDGEPRGSMAPEGLRTRGNREEFAPPGFPNAGSQFPTGPDRQSPGAGRGPGGRPGAGSPPAAPQGPGSVRFVLQSKSPFDANAILQKLKEKLNSGNFQMSTSGNSATITLGFAGDFAQAVSAVDFGKVTAKDEPNRTITIELP